MPAGKSWFKKAPKLFDMPVRNYWHVYRKPYTPLSSNPASEARFALTGDLGMYYVAESIAAVLWETILRAISPDSAGRVSIEANQLEGYRVVELILKKDDVKCLYFNTPKVKHLFPPLSEEMEELKRFVSTSDHASTRLEARKLREELMALGIDEMPALCWQSNQCNSDQAFLLYKPPMLSSWWEAGTPIAMDLPVGHQLLERELKMHGFEWAPGDAT